MASFVRKYNGNFNGEYSSNNGYQRQFFDSTQTGLRRQQNFGNVKKGLCSYCNGNHLVVNCWKKNGYPPNFISRFSRANAAASIDEFNEQDLVEQEGFDNSESLHVDVPINNSYNSTINGSATGFTQEQLSQLAQLIQTQTQQSMQITMNSSLGNNTDGVYVASGIIESMPELSQEHILQANYSSNDSGNFLSTSTWIVDTRPAVIYLNLCIIKNIKAVENWHVLLPNNLRLKATHKGDIYVTNNFYLLDVLFVPTFAYNILSVTNLVASLHCELCVFCKILFDTGFYDEEEDWFS